jgi:hypothetical protein
MNAIFILWQILEKVQDWKIQIHFLFIEIKAAYDSVTRPQLYKAKQCMSRCNELTDEEILWLISFSA